MPGIPYPQALAHLRASACEPASETFDKQALLQAFHPDYQAAANTPLQVGVNRGDPCPRALARRLQSNAQIDDATLAGAPVVNTGVLIIGGGGAGCAAALTAVEHGARVILATKLRLGDSNTVMAEGGIQAAVGEDDSPQIHFEDTLRAGHLCADRSLAAQLARSGPESIRWLIERGMQFDLAEGGPIGGKLLRKKPGGATRARILSFKDYTGLEMMRVLREAVELEERITLWNRCPLVELLSDENGTCVGGVLYNLERHTFILVRASRVVLATGGAGRLHLNDFPTSNHYGATADGLILAYRIGARLREVDSFQYHPTGLAWPSHRVGGLISEAARSAGAYLVNGLGQRFIPELQPRDVVSSAILRECAEGRGVERDGQLGVFLDTPGLERNNPGILKERLVSLGHAAHQCGIDPAVEPLMVRPTLHYQNGGVAIDENGQTSVSGLYCVGEISGGIHGRNRMMGNALAEIITFGRRTGEHAARTAEATPAPKVGLWHLYDWQRQLIGAGLPLDVHGPELFPGYGNFDLRQHSAVRRRASAPLPTARSDATPY
ncbi:succinate dehydrogenase / fumarate reductase flavoprotein subunit/L-aspartate oxidase [Pseudomonas flavescens]|uniref:Succinate dehydrogenase / fumarate reductase flavoprotein subunit/L-aspartate oxidase n=1 Tax=Phytopseudomonas flavescens TaxID=29435 RepID=A0A1G7X9P0_9GAMM|nr:FAD-binding protein [Pseudomonas flavescens]SDG80932.1 succinate dehydrogenase / fumarate reductase flavoprotein subunit/L-aspartate oxidase [Pseudomonas flavescens]